MGITMSLFATSFVATKMDIPLVELEPRWIASSRSRPGARGTALVFRCPCQGGHCLVVPVANPLDGGAPDGPDVWGDGLTHRWVRKGEDFTTVTLTPSVQVFDRPVVTDPDGSRRLGDQVEHWHGFVTEGVVRTC